MTGKSKIKVLMASEYPYDEFVIRGGIEAVAFHLSQEFSHRSDIELHIVSFSNKVKKSHIEKRNSIHIHWLKHKFDIKGFQKVRSLTTDIIRLRKTYDEIKPDIFHIQGFSNLALACRHRDKVVISVHGVEAISEWAKSNQFYQGFNGFVRLIMERFTIKQAVKRADILISNSGSYVVDILNQYLKYTSFTYIDHAIDRGFFHPWSPPGNNQKLAVSVAGINKRKRTLDLVLAMEKVVSVIPLKLVILGQNGEKSYYDQDMDTIIKLKLEKHVIVDFDLNQEKLINSLKECSVFVLPSGQETAPMAIAAAMAVGRPIIASDVGGVSMMVEEGKNGFLHQPGDIDTLSGLLIELLSDHNKVIEFGMESRKIAESRFSPEVVAEKTINVYQKLLSSGK